MSTRPKPALEGERRCQFCDVVECEVACGAEHNIFWDYRVGWVHLDCAVTAYSTCIQTIAELTDKVGEMMDVMGAYFPDHPPSEEEQDRDEDDAEEED